MEGSRLLRARMGQPGPLLVGGAHDGLSSILVREAGFDAVWASGFEISAAHGVPDANILTMSDNLRAAAVMVEASGIPVVADCDNGYGNAINVIHTVRAYEREGIAAICIEDNVFPKRCSFYAGVKRELAPVEEHVGKIKACLDTRRNDDFAIIARTEALIAGWGMDEALLRGRAYADAGADFVLIHSKSPEADEVLGFAERWDRETPLVCVPTIYKSAKASVLADAGFRMIIYANHGLRSSIKAMREAFALLVKDQMTGAVEHMVVPLNDVYELIGVPKMKREERDYLPAGGVDVGAVLLAAGASPELGDLVKDRPKAMLDIKGKPLIAHQMSALNAAGIKDISAVVGYRHEAVKATNLKTIVADSSGGELESLMRAASDLDRRTMIAYGDILFDTDLVERLLQTDGDIVVVVDRSNASERPGRDLVKTGGDEGANGRSLTGRQTDTLEAIARDLPGANGEWIGMMMVSADGAKKLVATYEDLVGKGADKPLHQAKSLKEAALTDLLQELVARGASIRVVDTYKGWMEIDTFEDYRRAWSQVD
ncbi:MAG: isocitrate lyase/phosphoenolpyruvate mutase family protein [Planctomycetes bacterium]|nr:isocitrate lyase/phosphoenolpyruvate mutase family protein [Planctomycetota bacterium]MCB9824443.1 isocitrate lyase/phosphoenolpyruvate mutase family protein [Planctomycetota bacterium]MCB9830796.1 isocitrate lyase/phosphoenolpyruvate mutase family protein [Planctomycetota bacterium]MCB9900440.1 isocitrate lyase/phosphoenolpyruvate mutase family protein [Planctomycetota bacterium]